MLSLISETSTFYNSSRDVKVADRVYPSIHTHVTKDFVDNDGRRKEVNYLDGNKKSFVSYVENNKVVRSDERYDKPKTMKLGDRIYSGIVAKTEYPGKYQVYNIFLPSGYSNDIRVKPNGAVMDMNDFYNRLLMRKLKSPFVKIARFIIGK